MIDDEEKEKFQEGVKILTLPRKMNIKHVMTTERKSFFVYKSRICKEKAQNKVAKFLRRSRGKKITSNMLCVCKIGDTVRLRLLR
jgi:hypothetical protein